MTVPPRSMETWATLHRAHARLVAELGRRMEAERGVSLLEHGCLYELQSSPMRHLRMQELGDRLGISPSSVTRLVDGLEERGWVRREIPSDNRRIIHAVLTTDGRRAYVRNNRPFTRVVEDAIGERLGVEEMGTLTGLLDRLGAKQEDRPRADRVDRPGAGRPGVPVPLER